MLPRGGMQYIYIMYLNRILLLALTVMTVGSASAQKVKVAKDYEVTLTGSLQSDILIPQEDNNIGTGTYKDDVLTNTYAELHALSKYVDAGARFEYLDHPLPGFEKDFKGWGVPFYYIKGKLKNAELTLGNYYEQFGSGFILRTYEERSLGIDNSLLGGHLVLRPAKGVQLKALSGKQRRYWDHNDAWVSGADVELGLAEWFPKMQQSGTYLTLGGSWVNKHEKADQEIYADPTHKLNLPENVNAFDVRANLQKGNFSVLAEYAQKTEDPSFDKNYPYIYRKGYVAMLSTSYSKSGMSILLQAKRSDNMSFRSSRVENGTSSYINHLPAFAMQQTYALAALYPYATQPNGEWAYQAELGYKFKRNTFFGGKYGTSVKLNFSHIHSLEQNPHDGGTPGTDGYGSAFWKWGDKTYYQDINVQIEKKLSKDFKLNLMYMNQFYNKSVVEGEGGMIHSDIYIAEGKYRFNRKLTLRGEAQYLHTKEDQGDWWFGLLELSVLPNFMFTISDQYNGNEHYYTKDGSIDAEKGTHSEHYINGSVTFTSGAHRLQIGYGKTRAGYNCSGGVCRYVPASKGVTMSYNFNF